MKIGAALSHDFSGWVLWLQKSFCFIVLNFPAFTFIVKHLKIDYLCLRFYFEIVQAEEKESTNQCEIGGE